MAQVRIKNVGVFNLDLLHKVIEFFLAKFIKFRLSVITTIEIIINRRAVENDTYMLLFCQSYHF